MSHLRADNRSYCSFLAHSMPSGTYRKLADTCRVTELNHKCIIIKFSPTALFASDCTYEYMNIVQLKASYSCSSKPRCLWKWESLKAGGV